MTRSIFRGVIYIGLWIPLLISTILDFREQRLGAHLDFLVAPSGEVSILQREGWYGGERNLRPRDRVIEFGGVPFNYLSFKEWIQDHKPNDRIKLKVKRGQEEIASWATLKRYAPNELVVLFYLPLLLSIIFLGFAVMVPITSIPRRPLQEAVEVFGLLCYITSLFFLTFFSSASFGIVYPLTLALPICGILLIHLCLVYPKQKGNALLRKSLLAGLYFIASVWIVLKFWTYHDPRPPTWIFNYDLLFLGFCFLFSTAATTHTLLTSKDFWARRRARLLSLVSVLLFVAVLSVFVAFVWDTLQVSVERVLAISLFFPAAFTAIILKQDVFNLERFFRKGIHQLLLLVIAVTLAVLVGLGWSQWVSSAQGDWMLWVSIAIVVTSVARPAGSWVENTIHKLIRTRVRYPMVNEIFESAPSTEEFLRILSIHFQSHLGMGRICFQFFSDPTQPWDEMNEQIWDFKEGELKRSTTLQQCYRNFSDLSSGDALIGRISFEGGDALAFDPRTSPDWRETVASIARGLEILCLREYLRIQESYVAVGRMQALLAHDMKNPLAIINICAGLLTNHLDQSDEADELIRTIKHEITRVTKSLQRVFDHSGQTEQKQNVEVGALFKELKEQMKSRFSERQLDVELDYGKEKESLRSELWLHTEPEALRQTLTNLVTNAFEAGAQKVKIKLKLRSTGLTIGVEDNGPGLPEGVEAFRPFATTKPGGTGLGLSHVKGYMTRHGGQVKVESLRNQGTTFLLEFSPQIVLNEDKL